MIANVLRRLISRVSRVGSVTRAREDSTRAAGVAAYLGEGLRVSVTVTPTGSAEGAPTARFFSRRRTHAAASGLTPLGLTSTPSARSRARTRKLTLSEPDAA